MKPHQPNQSLIDGITILQVLAGSNQPVSCSELSKELKIEVTRVNRILKTFAYIGITHQTASRKYISGPGMHVLAAQSLYGSGLLQSSIKQLKKLTKYGFIVALGVLWMDKVSFLFHWEPGMDVEDAIGRITLQPATLSGVGMALLASKTDVEISKIYHEKEIPGYGNSIEELLLDIRKIRKQGYSSVLNNPAAVNIAVTIGSPVYAGIAIAGDIQGDKIDEYVDILIQTAHLIEQSGKF